MTPRQQGYTLLELVLVIVLLGILAAIALPKFDSQATNAAWYYEQVRSAIRYAQRTAVAQRRCVFVTVSATQVSLFYGDASCALSATPVTQLADGQSYMLPAPTGAIVSGAPGTFGFNGLGQPTSAATVSISGRAIVVSVETGYVQ